MLIDGGVAINLMSYVMFKKLEQADVELVKTNLTLNGVGGNTIEARGIVYMELTIGSKSLAIAFFIVKVQGNYSAILGHNWIHTNHCVPSTLHQFLIQ
jgi:predicted house-cleaning NTP pyrophosphatase (Maf/HAM1 superfamily)